MRGLRSVAALVVGLVLMSAGLSLVGCASATKNVPQSPTPVPKPAITLAEAKALSDRFLADGASPQTFNMAKKQPMADPVIKSFDLPKTMAEALDPYIARLKEAKQIAPKSGNLYLLDAWAKTDAVEQARAALAASSTAEIFDLGWSGVLNDEAGEDTGKFSHTPAAEVASTMLWAMLEPLGEPKRAIALDATNTISVTPDGGKVTHRYLVEKRGDAWVIVGMSTLGDTELARAKQDAALTQRALAEPSAAELKKAFGKDKRLWMGQDKDGIWWVALKTTIGGGGVMRDEVYAYMAHRQSGGFWAKYDLGAPDGNVQVNSESEPVPNEVIAAMKKAGLQVRVTSQ